MGRIIKNLAEDILTDPMKAKYGFSQRIQAMGKLAALFGAGAVLKAGIEKLLLSDDDKKELEGIIPLLPEYMKGKTMAGVGAENGTGRMVNLNPWLPAEDFTTMAKNILSGDLKAFAVNNPIVSGRSPIISAAVEMATGRDPFTGKEDSGPYERFVEPIQQSLTPPILPGGYTFKKLQQGFTRNEQGGLGVTDAQGRRETPGSALLSAAGVSVAQMNKGRLLQRQQRELQEQDTQAKTKMRRILRSDVNDAAKDEARAEYREERKRIFRK